MVKSTGVEPGVVNAGIIFETDAVFFRNVDSGENITHIISVDMDGDGQFGGAGDRTSVPLSNTCELDASGNKTDENCEVTFLVSFEAGDAGAYDYRDVSSSGVEFYGCFVITSDSHDTEHSSHSHEGGHDESCEEVEGMGSSSFADSLEGLLLTLGFLSIGVSFIILLSPKPKDEEE